MLQQPVIRNPWSQAGIMDPWLGHMIVVYWARLGQTVGWGRRLELEMLGGYLTGLNRVLRVRRLAAMAAWLCTFVWNKHCCHQRSPEVPWKPMQLKTPKVTHQWGWSIDHDQRWSDETKMPNFSMHSFWPQAAIMASPQPIFCHASQQHFLEGQPQLAKLEISWSL